MTSASTSFVQQENDENFDTFFQQEEDEINMILHPRRLTAVSNLLACSEPKGSYDKIVQYLETNCGITEADESRAWAFFYMGSVKERNYCSLAVSHKIRNEEDVRELLAGMDEELLREMEEDGCWEDPMEIIEIFEKSLAQGKSCKLRYLASWKLGDFYDEMRKRLQGIRCYKIQLEEAEATGWKHAKVCALFNLCKALCMCGEFEEAIRIERELEMMGRHDLFTRGLSLHCHGHMAWVMSNFNECIEANNSAIHIVSTVRQDCTPQMSGIMLELFPLMAIEAKQQIMDAKQGQGIFGKVEVGAKMLSLVAILNEEDDEFYKSIICHQYAVARKDVELIDAANHLFLHRWRTNCNPKFAPITNEQKSQNLERIMHYLIDRCKIEAEESRAWAFYYVGEILNFERAELLEFNQQREIEVPNAIDMLEQSLMHAKSSILRYEASWTLAYICNISGEYAKEIGYREIQLKEAHATTWKGSNSKVYALYYLCYALCRNSQFEEAIRFQEQLSEVEPDDPFQIAEGLSLFCEAVIAQFMGNYDKAIQAFREAIAILEVIEFREIRDDIISAIWIPVSLAQGITAGVIAHARSIFIAADLKEHEERQLRSRRNEIMQLLEPDFWRVEQHTYSLLLTEGEVYLENKNFDEAEAVASKLLEISQREENVALYARALMFTAKVAASCNRDNIDVVECFCAEAQKLVAKDRANVYLKTVGVMEADLYFSMGKLEKAIEKYKLCIGRFMDIQKSFDCSEWRISYLETMKSCFGHMQLCILFLFAMQNENDPSIILEENEVSLWNLESKSFILKGNEVKHALIWAERERARDLLYGIQKRWDHHAFLNDFSVFDRDDIQAWTELENVCSLIGQDTVFIVFAVTSHALCIYFFRAGKEVEVNVVTNFSHLSGMGLGLEEATQCIINKDTNGWKNYLSNLFIICIGPFKKRLEDGKVKKIIIVPNGEMSLVPFAALIDREDEDRPFLIQKYEISTISSLRMFKHCERRREYLTETSEERSALVVGDPTKNLVHAMEEAQTVANILKDAGMNTSLLVNEQATTQAVSGFLPTSFWIHMACHATFEKDIPSGALMLSRNVALDISFKDVALVLASTNTNNGCSRNIKSVAPEDLLTAEKIANGGEIRAVAAILSACSSGGGRVCAEGTLGLTRSLHLAGVPTVVASIWKVEDAATTEFMKRFYTNVRDGYKVATSLRRTMVSMIKKNYEPLHWAPFFISGSPSLKLHRYNLRKSCFTNSIARGK